MKRGDLIQYRRLACKPKKIGILLDDPVFPRYGNYPKRYRVMIDGKIEEWIDDHKIIIEKIK